MAQVAQQSNTGQDVATVKLGELIDQIYETISKIDVGAEEEDMGIPLDPKLLARATSLETLTLVAFIAERERAKRTSADLKNPETMLGKPNSKRLTRKLLHALLWYTKGMTGYELKVRLPEGALYRSFTEWLPNALAQVAKEDQVGGKKLSAPSLKFRPIGEKPAEPGVIVDNRTPGGHSLKIIAAVKEQVLKLNPPATT